MPAYFGKGTKLTVLEKDHDVTPPIVKVFPPSKAECKNQKDKNTRKKTLLCVATGFYPDHVSVVWSINGIEPVVGVATDSAAVRDGKFYKITSRLRVRAEVWFDPQKQFLCTVKFFDGKDYISVLDSIYGVTDDSGGISREVYLKITQNAKLSYVVFIVKSCVYGAFVCFLVWTFQSSGRKQRK
ncbi:T cell receptor beta chain MC.7.G5 isoform 2-T2 [Menidia menidia]